jgi:hypothetical protein
MKLKCPICRIPLSLASFEQIWCGPDFEHGLTYYCEACNIRFGAEPYEQAEQLVEVEYVPKRSNMALL